MLVTYDKVIYQRALSNINGLSTKGQSITDHNVKSRNSVIQNLYNTTNTLSHCIS